MTRTKAIIEAGVETLAIPKTAAPLLEMVCQMYLAAQWLDEEDELED